MEPAEQGGARGRGAAQGEVVPNESDCGRDCAGDCVVAAVEGLVRFERFVDLFGFVELAEDVLLFFGTAPPGPLVGHGRELVDPALEVAGGFGIADFGITDVDADGVGGGLRELGVEHAEGWAFRCQGSTRRCRRRGLSP